MEHVVQLLEVWLAQMKIRIDFSQMRQLIRSHPDGDSIKAVSDTFDELGVPNIVIEVKSEDVINMPLPFFTLINKGEQQEYVLVEQKDKETIGILKQDGAKIRKPLNEFLAGWNHIIMIAEPPEAQASLRTGISRRIQALWFSSCLLFCVSSVVVLYSRSWELPVLMAASIVGLIISVFAFQIERGSNSILPGKFCKPGATNTCGDIIGSKDSAIGWFNLAEISLSFFLTAIVMLLVFTGRVEDTMLTGALCMIWTAAIPFTIYSLWYQFFKIKKWCKLCLGIVVIVWMQLLITVVNMDRFQWSLYVPILFAIVFGLWLTLILLLKPLLDTIQKSVQVETSLLKFRRNYHLFMSYYDRQRPMGIDVFNNEIIIGSINAPLQLLLVANPVCPPCAALHKTCIKILEKHPDEICIIYRFKIPENNFIKEAEGFLFNLMDIRHNRGNDVAVLALNDWFDKKNFSDWNFDKTGNSDIRISEAAKQHLIWSSNVQRTPMIFINGSAFPDFYHPEDIQYFIPHLLSYHKTRKEPQISL